MADQDTEELGPSDLGTLDYWERIYSEEFDNFKDHGDTGEIWFGRNNSLKIVRWINTQMKLHKDDKIIDIGCGNGMTLVELAKVDFKNLMGVDYSQKAIDLAAEILKENNLSVDLRVCDILNLENSELPTDFKLAHDKGTYDAISLHPEDPATKRQKYIENVYKILQPAGYLVLTSCNWTKEEIEKHFENYFVIRNVLPSDTFRFGGQCGNTITQLVLQKK
ncbi:EEF1A lysine methyltransferase 2 isoform X2 [Megachile rotundata]|uniref:EEF1A lysine methyltransferase 2 isoform X2 n=1 Tax=Megachile rotundata TaxID=143995 RepID=UPI000258F010|nr:PREDICTED: protein-lysine N-methyltransferase Mettl10 isoform X1 [Megachile rotundata]XP_012147803.1 PREDICTED: protein-lysine N-methyltransferase Mettl10 isoform X1 [Megachile rotundata]